MPPHPRDHQSGVGKMSFPRKYFEGLQSMLRSGELADLIITCKGRTFNVHRMILSAQSGFFRGACTGNFKVPNTAILRFQERYRRMISTFQIRYNDSPSPPCHFVSLQASSPCFLTKPPISHRHFLPPIRHLSAMRCSEIYFQY